MFVNKWSETEVVGKVQLLRLRDIRPAPTSAAGATWCLVTSWHFTCFTERRGYKEQHVPFTVSKDSPSLLFRAGSFIGHEMS